MPQPQRVHIRALKSTCSLMRILNSRKHVTRYLILHSHQCSRNCSYTSNTIKSAFGSPRWGSSNKKAHSKTKACILAQITLAYCSTRVIQILQQHPRYLHLDPHLLLKHLSSPCQNNYPRKKMKILVKDLPRQASNEDVKTVILLWEMLLSSWHTWGFSSDVLTDRSYLHLRFLDNY